LEGSLASGSVTSTFANTGPSISINPGASNGRASASSSDNVDNSASPPASAPLINATGSSELSVMPQPPAPHPRTAKPTFLDVGHTVNSLKDMIWSSPSTSVTAYTQHQAPSSAQHFDPDFFLSPTGAGLAFVLTAAGLIASIAFYLFGRREQASLRRLLFAFDLKTKIEAEAGELLEQKKSAEKELRTLSRYAEVLKRRIPSEARAAFFRNSIPEIDRQIFELTSQRDYMAAELRKLGATSPEMTTIRQELDSEMTRRLVARTRFERSQTTLAILAAIIAAIGSLIPWPLSGPLASMVAVGMASSINNLLKAWSNIYPEDRWVRIWVRNFTLRATVFCVLLVLALIPLSYALAPLVSTVFLFTTNWR
jgi:hypothetical protein